jgi:hypothetical protein
MKVLITGSSGMIGAALAESLVANGHEVIRLRRQKLTDDSPMWDPENGVIDLADVRDINAVVHLAGENVAKGRWNSQKKGRILHSRVMGTKLLADYFSAADYKPDIFVSASAIGVYGNRGDELVDETSEPGSGFMADVCKQWEAATASASDAGIRVAHARIGVVLSTRGGALKTMLLPFKLGLGGVFGTGKQFMSWVSLDDVVGMIQFLIAHNSLQGPVNLVAPNAVSNREFTKTLGRALHRPTIFSLPAFVARMAFGEMADELLLASTRVLPKKLIDSGYQFLHPELEEAFEQML